MEASIRAIKKLFSKLNEQFFGGSFEIPIVYIQPRGKVQWDCRCSDDRVWYEKDSEGEGRYEFVICEDVLSWDLEDVALAMMKEMVHMYDGAYDAQDRSRGGTYNNEQYKRSAEFFGLVVAKCEKHGYVVTGMSEKVREFIQGLEIKIPFYRKSRPAKKSTGQRREKRCPHCGAALS